MTDSCAAGCPSPTEPEALSEYEALEACRSTGAGSQCETCGGAPDAGPVGDPILDQQCSASTDPDPCDRCLQENCCETEAACDQSAACGQMYECYQDCSTAPSFYECMHDCREAFPEGADVLAPAGACTFSKCMTADACDTETRNCLTCTQKQCAEVFVRCFEDPSCYLITMCVPECGSDYFCQQDCIHAYSAEAASLFDQYTTCLLTKCEGCA